MESFILAWGGIAVLVLIAIAHVLKLKPREGPTPLKEAFCVCGGAAAVAAVVGYPQALIPVGILAAMLIAERWHR
jgi:hypothetical protein